MLIYRDLSATSLAEKLSCKKYSLSTLVHKITRETIKYSEVKKIADILGFEIKFIPKKDWQDWE